MEITLNHVKLAAGGYVLSVVVAHFSLSVFLTIPDFFDKDVRRSDSSEDSIIFFRNFFLFAAIFIVSNVLVNLRLAILNADRRLDVENRQKRKADDDVLIVIGDGSRSTTSSIRQIRRRRSHEEEPNWCSVCSSVKEPRVHHCKICDVCVTRRDHHCYVIGECIGARNQGHFILFLAHCAVGLTFSLWFVLSYLSRRFVDFSPTNVVRYYVFPFNLLRWCFIRDEIPLFVFPLSLFIQVSILTWLSTMMYAGIQFYLVAIDFTWHEWRKGKTSVSQLGSRSTLKNLRRRLGRKWYMTWAWPWWIFPTDVDVIGDVKSF